MKVQITGFATTSLLVLGLHVSAVHAQTAASESQSNTEIPQIVVTAQKRSQSLMDVGETVNVVDSQQLSQQQITTAADLTRVVPGLTVAANGDGPPIYTLRGVSFNVTYFGAQPTVSVYLDEAPLPFPVMTEGALLDLQRVEVLKGPQGTLFGQNATAGAINYIAAKPTDQFEAGVLTSYGRFNTLQAAGFVSGPIAENLNAALAVSATNSGPWQQSATRDAQLGDQRKFAGRLLLDWHPADKLKVALNINGWLDNSDTQAPQVLLHQPNVPAEADPRLFTTPITATDARNADWDADQLFRRHNNFYQAALRADYELGDHAVLTSLTDYTKVNIDSTQDFDGTYLPLNSTTTTGFARAISEELRLSGDVPNSRVHYLLGAYYQDDKSLENYDLHSQLGSAFRNVAGFAGNFDDVIQHGLEGNQTKAGFANLDWLATDRLTLSGGFRESSITHTSQGCTLDNGDGTAAAVFTNLSGALRGLVLGLPPVAPFPAGGCVTLGPTFTQYDQNDSFTEDSFSWRLNSNYKINSDLLLYATVSRGFKGGNYPVPAAANYVQLAPVRQERLTAYEAGEKARLFENRLALNAAVFYYDYKDKQLETPYIDPIFGQLDHLANIPKSWVRGVDLDATLVPVTGLTLRSAVTYANSIVGNFSGFNVVGNPVSLTGLPFPLAPKWISVNDVEYTHALTGALDGFVGTSYTYNSDTHSYLGDDASLEVRSFGLLDLRAGISSTSKNWELMAYARNLTNVYTWSYARTGGDNVLRYANMPRTYGVMFSYKFGP